MSVMPRVWACKTYSTADDLHTLPDSNVDFAAARDAAPEVMLRPVPERTPSWE